MLGEADILNDRTTACAAPWKPFLLRLTAALIILLPFTELGTLLAVAAHEALGHGLTALCLGGSFLLFQMDLDGMGWAWTYLGPDAPHWKEMAVLAGGVISTTVLGIALLLLGLVIRKPLISLIALVLSFSMLMDGTTYIFWNSVNPIEPGDIGRIIMGTNATWLRPALIAAGSIMMLSTIWLLTAWLFRRLESWLGVDGRLYGGQRIVVLSLLALVPASLAFFFDWDQLAPGLGHLPNVIGVAIHVAIATSLFWIRFRPSPSVPSRRAQVTAAVCGYAFCAAAVAVVLAYLAPS